MQLGYGDKLRAKTTVHAEDFVINKCGDRHAVEHILEFFPHADGVSTLAFVIKAIDTVYLAALVITTQQEEVLLKLDFVGQKQDDRLK